MLIKKLYCVDRSFGDLGEAGRTAASAACPTAESWVGVAAYASAEAGRAPPVSESLTSGVDGMHWSEMTTTGSGLGAAAGAPVPLPRPYSLKTPRVR